MRVKAEDRIGTIINGWKIIEIAKKDKHGRASYKIISTITGKVVTNAYIGNIQRHHHSHYPHHYWSNQCLHGIFEGMKDRCYNQKHRSYNNYGGRNITICQEWLDNPKAFEEWALENGYQDGLTIDRINPDDNYKPSNCRWITHEENSKWKRHTQAIWISNYVDTGQGWSLKTGKYKTWFNDTKRRHSYDYAYQRLLEEIEKLGGIKKVMGVDEAPDITQFLEDIENDCLEVDL